MSILRQSPGFHGDRPSSAGIPQHQDRMESRVVALASLERAIHDDTEVDLGALAQRIVTTLRAAAPERSVRVTIEGELVARGDARLFTLLLEDLLAAAWAATAETEGAEIAFGRRNSSHERSFFVRDNGAGFDMRQVDRVLGWEPRFYANDTLDRPETDLANARRIVSLHGGGLWADSEVGLGTTVRFVLP